MKRTVVLVISVILLLISAGAFGYLYYKNHEVKKEIQNSSESIKKLEDAISNEKTEITEKEDEYEKLKEKVHENVEELSIWENLKEELNKSLS